jgi:hypothetical protein
VKNVLQGLEAGFDEVVCVAVNRFIEEKILGELEKRGVVDGRGLGDKIERNGCRYTSK